MPPSDLAHPKLDEQAGVRFAFQPYVDTVQRTVVGHEALLRGPLGQSPDRIMAAVAPAQRHAFDQMLRAQALAEAASLDIALHNHQLSLNVLSSGIGCHGESLIATLESAARLGISNQRLVLEITEIEKVADAASLRALLQDLRPLGFRTAIDDLGAGWSSLVLLAELQPDVVKLDRALIEGIDVDQRRSTVVRWIKGACDDMGCEIIAEGVETPGESATLQALGIHLQQGFLFSRPRLGQLNLTPDFPA